MTEIPIPNLDLYQSFTATLDNVTLKVPTVEETFALARIIQNGLFPGIQHAPTFGNWYDNTDRTASARRFAGDVIADWGAISPVFRHLHFVILLNGHPVGRQSIMEETTIKKRRDLTTGSWIDPEYRWQGIGQKARWIILTLAFQHMQADHAYTAFLPSNTASQRISENCGYVRTGYDIQIENGKRTKYAQYTLTRATWETQAHPTVAVEGFTTIAEKLGLV